MNAIKAHYTPRCFVYGEFRDDYGLYCSMQESSAVEPHLWLGIDKDSNGEPVGPTVDGHRLGLRMHLSQALVKELLPLLQYFADTGELPPADLWHTLTDATPPSEEATP